MKWTHHHISPLKKRPLMFGMNKNGKKGSRMLFACFRNWLILTFFPKTLTLSKLLSYLFCTDTTELFFFLIASLEQIVESGGNSLCGQIGLAEFTLGQFSSS